jgi:hypothetical protein
MAGISAIHDSLRSVDSGACHIDSMINVADFAYRAAMNPHADKDWLRQIFERARHLKSTAHRRLRAIAEYQGHPISGRYAYQSMFLF